MNRKRLTIFVISLLVFLVFILTTSPYRLPLILIVVPGAAFIIAVHSILSLSADKVPIQPKAARSLVTVLTIILSVLAVLLSVGQLTFRDFALLLALALFGMFYLSRMGDKG